MLGNNQPKGGSVTLTVDPKAQTAAYDGLRALGPNVEGAVVALEPVDRARSWRWSATPTYDPNKLASHDFSQVQDAWKQLTNATRTSRC